MNPSRNFWNPRRNSCRNRRKALKTEEILGEISERTARQICEGIPRETRWIPRGNSWRNPIRHFRENQRRNLWREPWTNCKLNFAGKSWRNHSRNSRFRAVVSKWISGRIPWRTAGVMSGLVNCRNLRTQNEFQVT